MYKFVCVRIHACPKLSQTTFYNLCPATAYRYGNIFIACHLTQNKRLACWKLQIKVIVVKIVYKINGILTFQFSTCRLNGVLKSLLDTLNKFYDA